MIKLDGFKKPSTVTVKNARIIINAINVLSFKSNNVKLPDDADLDIESPTILLIEIL